MKHIVIILTISALLCTGCRNKTSNQYSHNVHTHNHTEATHQHDADAHHKEEEKH